MDTDILYVIVATALGYLVGGIPFGWIAGKLVKGIDIRYHGSGRVGATNTLRTLGWQVSALVFAADLLKGLVPVLVVRTVLNDPFAESTVALAAMIGHCWSPYLGFYGGRGVTTSLGSVFAFHPLVAVAGLSVTICTVAVTRLVSLGSLLGSIISVLLMVFLVANGTLNGEILIFGAPALGVIFLQHRDNLGRLFKGSERRIGEQAVQAKDTDS
jgi:glycerol-3-phosphate acyltransferase PlsY